MNSLAVLCLLMSVFAISVYGTSISSFRRDDDDAPCGPCPAIEDPVCGLNGVTYGNECAMDCLGVQKWRDGPCGKTNCKIPKIYKPVCGKDGNTYINKQHAKCNEVEVQFNRECEEYE